MNAFYLKTLQGLLAQGILSRQDRILVTCAAGEDREVLKAAGFSNVVGSNLFKVDEAEYRPFQWSYQDAEALTFEDGAFDFCMVHAGLHHCRSPHQGLMELYRVARKGLLAFEPLDNPLVRLGTRMGLAQEFETGAVAGHDYRGGGWRNTIIPNYVHRWTRGEIIRAVNSYAPYARHRFLFFHSWDFSPICEKLRRKGKMCGMLATGLQFLASAGLNPPFARFGNLFAFVVLKPELPRDLHPWLELRGEDIGLNYEWFRDHKLPNPEHARQALFKFSAARQGERK